MKDPFIDGKFINAVRKYYIGTVAIININKYLEGE